ncbi:hypothetical protein [Streptomyces sp. NPDC000994]
MAVVLGWQSEAMKPWSTSTENELRHLLNEWDPIGVADLVQDEYDCMLALTSVSILWACGPM